MKQILNVVTDRGSKYAVSGCPVESRADVDAALKALKRNKKFAKATHNTWAAVMSDGTPLKGDDGESGAGLVKATSTAKGELTALDIDPSIFHPDEKEMVEDLILAAIKDAQTKASAKAQEEMSKLTEGLGLPKDMKLPF